MTDRVLDQCTSQMLGSLGTDMTAEEIECGECLCEWMMMTRDGRGWERRNDWPCSWSMHQPDVGLPRHRSHSRRDWVWWVSVWVDAMMTRDRRGWETRNDWPCSWSMHQPDVGLPRHRSDFQERSSVVSVCVSGCDGDKGSERMRDKEWLTVFLINAPARCWAPSAPIWLPERSSVVSVCVSGCDDDKGSERMRDKEWLTVFLINAPARCWAPSSPISFPERYSVVSVCVSGCDEGEGGGRRRVKWQCDEHLWLARGSRIGHVRVQSLSRKRTIRWLLSLHDNFCRKTRTDMSPAWVIKTLFFLSSQDQ